ncbi:AAA family ATPase [Planctomycetota bacterium]
MMAIKYDTSEEVELYSKCLWQPGEIIEARCLPVGKRTQFWCKTEELSSHIGHIQFLNLKGITRHDIYCGVLPRLQDGGSRDEHCAPGHILWADFDHTTVEQALESAKSAGMPKSTMAINSGHGCHLYWRFEGSQQPEIISQAVGDLADLLKSDPSVKNPSRILRLPGFTNWKKPVAPCQIIEANPHRKYSFAELRQVIPIIKREDPPPAQPDPFEAEPVESGTVIARAEKYISSVETSAEGSRNNQAYKAAAGLTRSFNLSVESALPILSTWNQGNSPPLSQKELIEVCKSAQKNGKHPPGAKLNSSPKSNGALKKPRLLIPKNPVEIIQAELQAQKAGERQIIKLDFAPRVSELSKFLRPGNISILGGPEGNAKTFFCLAVGLAVERAGLSWACLQLEGEPQDHYRRLIAVNENSWDALEDLEDSPDAAEKNQNALNRNSEFIQSTGKRIIATSSTLSWQQAIKIITEKAKTERLIILDSVTFIDFGAGKSWEAESRFMQELTQAIKNTGCTLVLVLHSIKRLALNRKQPLDCEDLQGASAYRRLAASILLLDSFDWKDVHVYRPGGMKAKVQANKQIIIGKSRHGRGKGQRIVFGFGKAGPVFQELGIAAHD